jgi:hypothetical protein
LTYTAIWAIVRLLRNESLQRPPNMSLSCVRIHDWTGKNEGMV